MRIACDLERMPPALLTAAEMAAVDRAAVAAGTPIEMLITRAGAAVATVAGELRRGEGAIAILCGPGNNGADGHLAAAALVRAGVPVAVYAEPGARSDRIGWAIAQHGLPIRPLAQFHAGDHGCLIDALYGAGLSRPIFGIEAQALRWLQESRAPVLAIDLPSGLDGDTGHPVAAAARADVTVTFCRLKPGHLLWPGRGLCGSVRLADIGIGDATIDAAVSATAAINRPSSWRHRLPAPDPAGHKYDRGHVLVVSGPEFRTGAARLAARAALRAGAGAVTLAGDPGALRTHAAHVTAIMLAEAGNSDALGALVAERRFSASVLGPAAGVGEETLMRAATLLAAGLPTVLDADALSSIGRAAPRLRARPVAGSPLVLTPHAGEFRRMFDGVLEEDARYAALPARLRVSKLEQARAAARLIDGVILYKGIDTVVAAADGRACIAVNAGPELATAGSGDVLAGVVAAHLGAGMPAYEATAAAVWLHAETGRDWGIGLTADDLADAVRPLARRLHSGA